MGVFWSACKLPFLFVSRLSYPLFSFVAWLFGIMDKSVGPDRRMGKSATSEDQSEQYDSTWEDDRGDDDDDDDDVDEESTEDYEQRFWHPRRNPNAERDIQQYRHYCKDFLKYMTNLEDDIDLPNIKFYRNQIYFYPDGVTIDEFHKKWYKDYERLEYVHSYIQWLFPIPEKGMNYASYELRPNEAKIFCTDVVVRSRLLLSYKVMLDFFGIQLVNEETGEVKRASNWKSRFENLNRNTHNNLRITRILKCLGLLDFGHYQAPLVHFFLEETLEKNTLQRVKQSVLDYFMFTVRDKKKRQELIKYAFLKFKPRNRFVWCPRRICNKFVREERASLHNRNSDPIDDYSPGRSNQHDLMSMTVQNRAEIKTDTNKDTSMVDMSIAEDRNDQNVTTDCQDAGKQVLPVQAAGHVHTMKNEGSESPKGVSQQRHQLNSESVDQKNDVNRKDIPLQKTTGDNDGIEYADSAKQSLVQSADKNIGDSTTRIEITDEISNPENDAHETPQSDGHSASEQEDDENEGDESKQGNEDQHVDPDFKKHDSVKGENESAATGTVTNDEANPACNDTEKSS